MNIRITNLWLMLLTTVAYDLVVTLLGIFPGHTAQERLAEDVKITFFIGLAWFVAKHVNGKTGP